MQQTYHNSWWRQVAHNRLIALVLAMLVVVPLVATPADTGFHGAAALVYEGMALLLMATLLWRTRWNFSRATLTQFATNGSHLPVSLFGVWATLSCLLRGHNAYGAQHLLSLGAGILLYFTVSSQFRRSEQLAKLVDTLVFLLIGVSLLGFAQYSAGQDMQAVGLFGDHQLFGSFLMILLPLVGVMALTEKHPGRQMMAQIATVFGVTALLISQARSAWIGAVAGLVVLGVLTLIAAQRNRTTAPKKHEIVLPVMLLVVAAGFFLMLWPQTATLLSRASSLDHMSAVDTWQTRQHTWAGAIKMIAASPLVGHGLGQYPVLQSRYTHEGMPIALVGGASTLTEQAHNFYLQTTAELGVIGMLLFAGILVTFWGVGVYRALHMDAGIRRSLLLGSLGATVAFAVDAFASPSWELGQIAMFLWLALGIGMSCMRRRSHNEAAEEAEATTISTRVSRPATAFAVLGVAVLLPTFALAGGSTYPLRAFLLPKHAIINSHIPVQYALFIVLPNGSTQDVSLVSPNTKFTETGGTGTFTGPNSRIYKPKAGEHDNVTVTGTYTFLKNGVNASVSDTGRLTVLP